jgi:peroxiredoxin
MAKTESNMLALGTPAPDFSLTDVSTGKTIHLREGNAQAHVLMFICNHCPFVQHVSSELTRLASDYLPQGVRFIAISSNDVTQYPADSPDQMIEVAKEAGYPFPYLYDESQAVAKAYQAACTPDFYVFDGQFKLVYRGQLDDSRPSNQIPPSGADIRRALDCLLRNKPLDAPQKPSLGCNIKWKLNV